MFENERNIEKNKISLEVSFSSKNAAIETMETREKQYQD